MPLKTLKRMTNTLDLTYNFQYFTSLRESVLGYSILGSLQISVLMDKNVIKAVDNRFFHFFIVTRSLRTCVCFFPYTNNRHFKYYNFIPTSIYFSYIFYKVFQKIIAWIP